MSKRLFCILFPLSALLLSGCVCLESAINSITIRGSGKSISEERDVRGFDAVRLAGVGELAIEQGDTESLSIEAEDNILPRIVTEVRGGRLTISTEKGYSIRPTLPVRYKLILKELTNLELSGSGNILAGPVHSGDISVGVSGSGDLRFEQLIAEDLHASISGSGEIRIPGRVDSQHVRISGSGSFDGRNLDSRSAEVSVSGSGDSTLWVRETLDIHVSGSGDVAYYGSPSITRKVSGSGSLRNLGIRP